MAKTPKAPMKTAQGRGLDAKTTANALTKVSNAFYNPKRKEAAAKASALTDKIKLNQKSGARMGRAQALSRSKQPK